MTTSHDVLTRRNEFIGASDAPVIMGVSPWKTVQQLWEEKIGLLESPPINRYMRYGIETEHKARDEFILRMGIFVAPKRVYHPDIDYLMANLDGISDCGTVCVEIKCPGEKDHLTAKRGLIPKKYIPQLQHQLACCDLEKMYYMSYQPDDIVITEVFRDNDYIQEMLKKHAEFWKCVKSMVAPAKKNTEKLDQEWIAITDHYKKIKYDIAQLEILEKKYKEKIISLCGGLECEGNGVLVKKINRIGSVNYASIEELKNIDLDKYRSPDTSYFSLKIDKSE